MGPTIFLRELRGKEKYPEESRTLQVFPVYFIYGTTRDYTFQVILFCKHEPCRLKLASIVLWNADAGGRVVMEKRKRNADE